MTCLISINLNRLNTKDVIKVLADIIIRAESGYKTELTRVDVDVEGIL